jgi:hypothetical protein
MKIPEKKFSYSYLAGPVETKKELATATEGNCRFALQLYFEQIHGLWLEKDQIYLPGGYKTLGKFIFEEKEINWSELQPGDIIYAERLRNKDDEIVDQTLEKYLDKSEWIYNFHSAIYVGTKNDEPQIWHATRVANGPALWLREKFLHYYKPISVKRLD